MSTTRTDTYTCDICGTQETTDSYAAPKEWTSVYGAIKAHICVSCSSVLVTWFQDAKVRLGGGVAP